MKKDKTNVGSRTVLTAMIILLLTITGACSKTEAPTPDEEKTGQFSIEFDNIMGEETLSFEPEFIKMQRENPLELNCCNISSATSSSIKQMAVAIQYLRMTVIF